MFKTLIELTELTAFLNAVTEMMIDDVTKPGWYAHSAKTGKVVEGPCDSKSDLSAEVRDNEGGEICITKITKRDLKEKMDPDADPADADKLGDDAADADNDADPENPGVDADEDTPPAKTKWTVNVKDADGEVQEKRVLASSIESIQKHYGDDFVDAVEDGAEPTDDADTPDNVGAADTTASDKLKESRVNRASW